MDPNIPPTFMAEALMATAIFPGVILELTTKAQEGQPKYQPKERV
jgi:hypothetical protein